MDYAIYLVLVFGFVGFVGIAAWISTFRSLRALGDADCLADMCFVGTPIGVLMAGGRGAIAGGPTAVIWLLIAIAALVIAVVLIARH